MKKAFTLIELLVVIAIIAILAAMLMPALERARQAAQRSTCASNVHNLGFAVSMFKDDNDGNWWVGRCTFYDYAACQTMAFIMNDGYVKDWDVLVCPQLDTPASRKPSLYHHGASWSRCTYPHLPAQATSGNFQPWWGPEESAYFYDEWRISTDAVPDRAILADGIAMCTEYGPEPANHEDGANVLFLDLATQWSVKLAPDERWTKVMPDYLSQQKDGLYCPTGQGCDIGLSGTWVRYGYIGNPRRSEDEALTWHEGSSTWRPVVDKDDIYEVEGCAVEGNTPDHENRHDTEDAFTNWCGSYRCETTQNGGEPSSTDCAVGGGTVTTSAWGPDLYVDTYGYPWRGGELGAGEYGPFYMNEGYDYHGWHWGVPEEFEERIYER